MSSQEVEKLVKKLVKAENTVKSLKGELKAQPEWERKYKMVLDKLIVQDKKVEKLEGDAGVSYCETRALRETVGELTSKLSNRYADEEVKAFAARDLRDLDVYLVTFVDESIEEVESEVCVLASCFSHAETIFNYKHDFNPITSIALTEWKVLMPNISPVHRKEED